MDDSLNEKDYLKIFTASLPSAIKVEEEATDCQILFYTRAKAV